MNYAELLERKNNYVGLSDNYANEIKIAYKCLEKEINRCRDHGQNVKFVVDFDTDGICSGLLAHTMYPDAEIVVTNRFDGYGIPKDLEMKEGDLFVFLDMGSNDFDRLYEISQVTGKIPFVIDHHEIDKDMVEDYDRLLNFSEETIDYTHTLNFSGKENHPDYCTTGLMYKLLEEFMKDEKHKDALDERSINTAKVYACIGTIGDYVSVNNPYDDNRFIIQEGIKTIQKANMDNLHIALLYYLDEVCEIASLPHITTRDFTHNVVSTINATGRIENAGAEKVFNLLAASNQFYADALVAHMNDESKANPFDELDSLKSINDMKKKFVRDVMDKPELADAIEKNKDKNIFVYVDTEMQQGVTRIVSNQLADKLHKPVIVFTEDRNDPNKLVGSGTNYKGFPNFYENVEIKELDSFGGHPTVAGMSVSKEKLKDCIAIWEKKYKDIVPQETKEEYLEINSDFTIDDYMKLEPFGTDFPVPKLQFKEVTLGDCDLISKRNPNPDMKKTVVDGFNVKTFSFGRDMEKGKRCTFEGELTINHFAGKETLEVTITDFEDLEKELVK